MVQLDPILIILLNVVLGSVLSIFLSKVAEKFFRRIPRYLFFWAALTSVLLMAIVSFLSNSDIQIRERGIEMVSYLSLFSLLLFIANFVLIWLKDRHGENHSPTLDQQANVETRQSQHKLRKKLLECVSDEVDLRRRNSLHNLVMIDLSMQEQPQQVGQPPRPIVIPDKKPEFFLERILLKLGKSPSKSSIDPTKKITEVFHEVYGKLLILGMPGSGKTTMLLDLAKELCTEARQNENEPIPVIFELSNWKDNKQSIADWLASEMKLKYNFAESITKQWLANHELLPFFDGLDELGLKRQVLCVEAINQFIKENAQRHLVICCRTVEYQEGRLQLALNNAVCLEPLTAQQIEKYLKTVQRFSLWSIIKSDSNLQKLANSPLFLTMIVIVYQGNSISSIQELFDAYIDYQFLQTLKTSVYTPGKEPSRQKTIYWLIWLAKTLKAESNTEFLIERMQLCYLKEGWQKWVYRASFGFIMGLISFIIFLNLELHYRLIYSVIIGLLCGLLSNSNQRIQTVELFQFSWIKETRIKFIKGLIIIITSGILIGLIGLVVYGVNASVLFSFFGGLLGLMSVLAFGWKGNFIVKREPNQEVWFSLKNAISIAGMTCLLTILFLCINHQFLNINFVNFNSLFPIIFQGISWGLAMSLFSGGIGVIQHFVLRLILCCNGYIPWNYARFLDYAYERKFLQKVGGHYRFIHDLLQEHFADLPLK